MNKVAAHMASQVLIFSCIFSPYNSNKLVGNVPIKYVIYSGGKKGSKSVLKKTFSGAVFCGLMIRVIKGHQVTRSPCISKTLNATGDVVSWCQGDFI